MLRLALAVVALSGCSSALIVRADSYDFLKKKAGVLSLETPQAVVTQTLDQLFYERGFAAAGSQAGENGATFFLYKGARSVPPETAAFGVQLGSWFAARVATVGTTTQVTLIGKPMIGQVELCSDHDEFLKEIKYTCQDTKVPPDWAGVNLVTGRDETEVVTWVLAGLYERLKH